MLEVHEINTFYGSSHILFDLSLSVKEGEVIFILGRNGAGKTTTLKSIMGILHPKSGYIKYNDKEITKLPSYKISRLGIGYVPEDRRIFPGLSVLENLEIAAKPGFGNKVWTLDTIYDLFPILKAREKQNGITLSGGEQQMLAVARTLMSNPQLLLLDEPSEGLAPMVVRDLEIALSKLKEKRVTMLFCEDSPALAYKLADRVLLIEKGKVGWGGSIEELKENEELKIKYLGV